MLTQKTFPLVLLFCILQVTTNAQSTKANFTPIFDDLPIDDPAKNSKIKGKETAEEKIRKNIFVAATLSKTRCYLGEPILLTYKLYSCLESSSAIQKRPSLLGFISYEIIPDNSIPEYKKFDGKNYRSFTIHQLQLVSLKEGEVVIDAIIVDNNIRYKRDDGQTAQYSGQVSGDKLTVIVEPLPTSGKPASFLGAVGDFGISATVKSVNFASNESNVLEIAIRGKGDFTNLSAPDIAWPAGIVPYSASERLDIAQTEFPLKGTKFFSIPFVAKEGNYTIPPVPISFFDASKKRYITVQSDSIQLTALPPARMPITVVGKIDEKQKGIPIYYWLLSGTLLVGITLFIILKSRKKRALRTTIDSIPATPAVATEEEPFDWKKELESVGVIDDAKEYLASFKLLLVEYLRNILGNENSREAQLLLELKTLDREIGELAESLCEQCNTYLYASESLNDSARSILKEQFTLLIDKANNIGS